MKCKENFPEFDVFLDKARREKEHPFSNEKTSCLFWANPKDCNLIQEKTWLLLFFAQIADSKPPNGAGNVHPAAVGLLSRKAPGSPVKPTKAEAPTIAHPNLRE
jgi:hypothetical protein